MRPSLYGRDVEAQALCEAYRTCFCENSGSQQQHIVLIHGSSGSGKTALVTQTLRPLLAEQKGLFLTGKADATAQWSRPYDVFVSAFQQLIQLLERHKRQKGPSEMEDIRDAILKEFGGCPENSTTSSDGLLLNSVIPGFEKVLQKRSNSSASVESLRLNYSNNSTSSLMADSAASTNGTEAVARLRYLLCRLCRTVASQRPLVLFLDDIQWCDRASLNLLNSIISSNVVTSTPTGQEGSDIGSLMVVCAYRDDAEYMAPSRPKESYSLRGNEEKKSSESMISPLMEFLEEWKEHGGRTKASSSHTLRVHDIPLTRVDEKTMNEILSGVYGLPQMEFYSELIYKASSGNIYLALQCVRQLCEEGLLNRCEETKEWKWDFSQLQAQDDATAQFLLNPAFSDIVRHSITQLSEPTQHVLSVASCFGMEIEEDVLSRIFRDESDIVPSVEKSLGEAIDEGLIVLDPIIGRFAFAHDRVQQAAHALIDDVEALSFEVGYKLWKRSKSSTLTSKIFAIVTLLNKGHSADMLPDDDCYAVATLNLEAGERAISIAAFTDATRYLENGVALLIRGGQGGTYWTEEYQLAVDLLSAAAEVEVFNCNFDLVDKLTDEICSNANCLDDKYRAVMARINASCLQGRVQEGVDIGTDFLRQLGEKMPSRASSAVMMLELFRTKLALRGKSNDVLMSLPPMTRKDKIAAKCIIKTMFHFSLIMNTDYTIVSATKSIRICLKYGSFVGSALSFTMYAYALCGLGNVDEGFRFGELAMSLLDRCKSREMLPFVHVFFYYGVHHRKRPLREGINDLKRAMRVGMEVGDVENAMLSESVVIHHCWFMGSKLQEVDDLLRSGLHRRKLHDHPLTHDLLQILVQMVAKLTGGSSYVDVSEFVNAVREHTLADPTDLHSTSLFHHCALLAYIFRDYDGAHDMVGRNTPAMRKTTMSTYFGFQIEWIDGLTSLAIAREGKNRRENMTNAKRILRQISKRAEESPSNYGHTYDLLKAEYDSMATPRTPNCTTNSDTTFLHLYDAAMEKAGTEGFLYVAALAAERAGDCMMRLGNISSTHHYWDKARSFYKEWGATAKVFSVATQMTTIPQGDGSFSSSKSGSDAF